MRRAGFLLGIVLWSGCSGTDLSPIGFVNKTQHSDAQLWAIWKAAQTHLSQQIDLNPLQQDFFGMPPQILAGDRRVWEIAPRQLLVARVPDISSAALYAASGINRPDPTGLIGCPQPCNVHYAPAYSFYTPPLSRYATSWEFNGNNFDLLLQYEFENHILNSLGYDMRWR
jgi:hypothetical protein